MKTLNLKYYLAVILIVSGILAICFESLSKGFVTFAPYGVDEYVYLRDIQGSADDDSILLWFFGIISVVLGFTIFIVKNINYILRIGFFVYIFLFLSAFLAESDPINQLVINTIKFDQNIYLILWLISLLIYTILFILLNIKHKPNEE
ncbi:hypothetical protein [Acinetobacter baumannii]|uniref:hypothetical protein n=1 Tax=Acinetobacter baumannii TaxID=470 RepID=UPI002448D5A2|nr:hypothetical protein [Acinetobacter baumannii]MDH2602165.1 hypothetical protein [Acinetobacter baumannii]MDK2170017.1 hypothetical protein [Acinetobacter baumannii]MDK2180838.1 hypothetical protein [Acinetobacter baumannii]MDK2326096.1 hypothetical protein [Acinetobacter baumannii]MDV7449607.1 hypothetical protein [Acinetobacter baumannii]